MEYMTARAQPTPKTKPRKTPMSALEKKSTMMQWYALCPGGVGWFVSAAAALIIPEGWKGLLWGNFK
jgi:hypothetical protein